MIVEYIVQPNVQMGRVLSEILESTERPSRVIFVSAFVGLQSIIRIKHQIAVLRESGTEVRFVLGIDLGGTSQEVLKEILTWNIDVRIVKHRRPGHTFHPKLFLFQAEHQGTIIIGSNNITEGGFFGNYEGAARIAYALPEESADFGSACETLKRFLNPIGPIGYPLTEVFLRQLITRGELPTEEEAREGRDIARRKSAKKSIKGKRKEHIFGSEAFEPPPPLPADFLGRLVKSVRERRKMAKINGALHIPIVDKAGDLITPIDFYMTLPTLQGPNIPGEGRIPLEAIELAKEFWGWPDKYSEDISPRSGNHRVYWNWRPKWRVWSVQKPSDITTQPVRMYMYENSSDFRFYLRPLVNAGGDLGDVVRVRRIAEDEAEYECVLARKGTNLYAAWIKYCTQPVRNSTRRFGYV